MRFAPAALLICIFALAYLTFLSKTRDPFVSGPITEYTELTSRLFSEDAYEVQYHRATNGMMFAFCAQMNTAAQKCFPKANGTVMKCECYEIPAEPEEHSEGQNKPDQ